METSPPTPFLHRKSLRWLVAFVTILVTAAWLINTPTGLLGKSDAVAYAVCHRIDLRSFHIGQRPIPLCARCTGMYLGAILGLMYQLFGSVRGAGLPSRRITGVLAVLVLAFGIDGLNSYLHFFPNAPTLYETTNWSRLLTGTGMGLVIAAALFPAFNQAVWKNPNPNRPLRGLRHFGGLVGLAVLLDLIVLTENPIVLYPLALISAVGVILILTLVYTMVWIVLFGAEQHYRRWSELITPALGGFGLAILQIALLDLGRYWLTGTWGGFHLG